MDKLSQCFFETSLPFGYTWDWISKWFIKCDLSVKVLYKNSDKDILCLDQCPTLYPYWNQKTRYCEMSCSDNNLNWYEYNKICYDKCPENTKPDWNKKCILNNGNSTNDDKDLNVKDDVNSVIKTDQSWNDIVIDILDNVINFNGTYWGNNYIAQIYPALIPPHHNDNYSNVNLDECKSILIQHYNISINHLIIVTIEIFRNQFVTNQLEYMIFSTEGELLNWDLCNSVKAIVTSPIKWNDSFTWDQAEDMHNKGVDVFNSSSEFFNDICTPAVINNTDIILKDRREYIYQNVTFCEIGCEYGGIDYTIKKVKCLCHIKTVVNTTEIVNALNTFLNPELYTVNWYIFTCYAHLFNWNNYLKNIGFWLFSSIIWIKISFTLWLTNKEYAGWFKKWVNNVSKNPKNNPPRNSRKKNTIEEIISTKISREWQSRNNQKIVLSSYFESSDNLEDTNFSFERDPNQSNCNTSNKNNLSDDMKLRKINIQDDWNKNFLREKKSLFYLKSESKRDNTNTETIYKKSNNDEWADRNKNNSFFTQTEQNISDGASSNHDCTQDFEKSICFKGKVKTPKKGKAAPITLMKKRLNTCVTLDIKSKSQRKAVRRHLGTSPKNLKKRILLKMETFCLIPFQLSESIKRDIDNSPFYTALNYDKRNFCSLFWTIFKEKEIFLRSILVSSPYECLSVNCSLMLFSLALDFSWNSLFYTDEILSERFINKGILSVVTDFWRSTYSCLVGIVWMSVMNYLSNYLTKLDFIVIETQHNKEYLPLIRKEMRKIKVKLIIFFIIDFLWMTACWYYVTIFCIVFHSSQMSWFTGAWLSFGISLMTSLGISFFLCLLRTLSLICKSRNTYNWSIYLRKRL